MVNDSPQKIKTTNCFFVFYGILFITMFFISANAFAAEWTNCTPENGASYDNRVHVKCTTAVDGIQYFAVSTKDEAKAARALSLISIAIVTGRDLSILYDPADTSGTAIACMSSDCRLFHAIAIIP